MDEPGVATAGWLRVRLNGLFRGLASDVDSISTPADIVEDHDHYRFSISLPGLKSASLEVTVEDDILVVDAERSQPAWAEDTRVPRAERHYGRIHRAFRLPSDVDREAVATAYTDGVLHVTIAKHPEVEVVEVEVSHDDQREDDPTETSRPSPPTVARSAWR